MREDDGPRAPAAGARLLGWLTAAAGVSVLVGWALDLPVLKSVLPGAVTMKANTALGFVLGGLSIALVPRGPASRLAGRSLAVATALLGALTLAQYVLQVDLGIDQLLFREPEGTVGTLSPGRMAPTSAVAFLLVGVSSWLARSRRTASIAQALALLVGLLGTLSTTGYAYGATNLFGIGRYTQMAVLTAVLFVVLGLGILLLHPAEGLMRTVGSRTPGGWVLRRMFPTLLAVPLLIGWIGVWGTQRGHWNSPFAVSVVVELLLVVLTGITYWFATKLAESEEARQRAEGDRALLQQQMDRTSRLAAMGTLVAGVAHEINNPLAGVLSGQETAQGILQQVQARARSDAGLDRVAMAGLLEEAKEALGDAQAGGRRVARIVKDLTTFGRPDARRARVHLADAVGAAMQWVSATVAQQAAVEIDDQGAPDIVAAVGQIEQVLVNLVANAAHATAPGERGVITIRLGRGAPGMSRLEVVDRGTGMSPGTMQRVFNPFFTTRPVGKGTGLGLAVSHAIVTAHGGTLTVESEIGKGSTFRIELPVAPA